ncbi:putative NRPS-like protein biosynthetic cluster [Bacidia gigantensis]|uniref:putative NRPS-like protein biosynthetic cluster n=1 Tax=Bacidia gigantensis TaxID=2732470 RepID=UPI001D0458D4|nr:putative NRPS-like protein biosynthetic cluster [Bacidia gigantensis]KAG8531163.1 putative NRPS-like protein biosynthetic cluster [Bacidia gigantensis]
MNRLSPEYLQDFLQYVRAHSAYYRALWNDVPQGLSSLEGLPLTNLDDYWNAAKENRLLTKTPWDGMIVRTGGTTSEPRVVYLARDEIAETLPHTGAVWSTSSGIRPGDRIANLFHIGGMYAGFAKMTLALSHVHTPHIHLPISGNETPPEMANFMKMFNATVVFSNVFTVCRIVDYLIEKGETIDSVRLILFAGETFYKDLRVSWTKAFPNVQVRPLMYGAADGGLIGIPVNEPGVPDLDIKPTYQVSQDTVQLEILTEDGRVITEPSQKGRVVLTDLKRRLHPVVRYPMGDLAQWIDYTKGTFELLGRESVALKIGSLFLPIPKLRSLVISALGEGFQDSFQLLVRRAEGKNEVTFRLAAPQQNPEAATRALEQSLITEFPKWGEYLKIGYIQPLKTEWVSMKDLVVVERSGKLKEIIEERFVKEQAAVNGDAATLDTFPQNLESVAPQKIIEEAQPQPQSQHREPLKLSGALDGVDYFEVTPCLGREYRGVDLAEWIKAPNSDELLRDLAITISQRGVVFFPQQDGINDENQKELMQRLGELSGKPITSRLHIHPIYAESQEARALKGNDDEISVVSSAFKEKSQKVYSDSKQSQAANGDKRATKVYTDTKNAHLSVCNKKQSMKTEWHSDNAFENLPADYTMLRLTELPRTGGDTLWASGYEIYDRISPPYQKFLETLTATYHYAGLDVFKAVAAKHGMKVYTDPRGAPENVRLYSAYAPTLHREHGFEMSELIEERAATHPIVRTNPVTGWRSLYGIGHHLKQINGLTKDESKMLEDWFAKLLSENHDLQLRHRWEHVNDMAIWDNRSMYHAATPDHQGWGHRTGHRAVSTGERPYFDPESKSRREAMGLAL